MGVVDLRYVSASVVDDVKQQLRGLYYDIKTDVGHNQRVSHIKGSYLRGKGGV